MKFLAINYWHGANKKVIKIFFGVLVGKLNVINVKRTESTIKNYFHPHSVNWDKVGCYN